MAEDQIEVVVEHTSQMQGGGDNGDGGEGGNGGDGGEGGGDKGDGKSAFDEAKYLTEKFGSANPDEINQALVLGKNYKQFESHIATAQKIAKNPNLAAFVDYVDGGGQDVPFIWNLVNTKVEELSNFDAIVLRELFENKDPETTKEIIEAVNRDKYLMDSTEDKDKDKSKYMLGKEGAAAKEFLKSQQSKYTLTDPQTKAAEQQQSELQRVKSWEPHIKGHDGISLKQQLKSSDIDLPVDFKWTPDEKANALYQQILTQTIKDVGLPYNNQNLETVRRLSNSIFVEHYLPQILSAAMSQTLTSAHKVFAAKYNGIPPEEQQQQIPGNGQGEDITVQRHQTQKNPQYNW